jgi:hypothetical protein
MVFLPDSGHAMPLTRPRTAFELSGQTFAATSGTQLRTLRRETSAPMAFAVFPLSTWRDSKISLKKSDYWQYRPPRADFGRSQVAHRRLEPRILEPALDLDRKNDLRPAQAWIVRGVVALAFLALAVWTLAALLYGFFSP